MLIVTSPEASYVNGGGVRFYDSSQFSSTGGTQSITATSMPNAAGGRVVNLSGLLSNISGGDGSATVTVPSELAASSRQNLPVKAISSDGMNRSASAHINSRKITVSFQNNVGINSIDFTGCQYLAG